MSCPTVTQQQVRHGVPGHRDGERNRRKIAGDSKDLGRVDEQQVAERVVLDTKGNGCRTVIPVDRIFFGS